jgi:predicted NBD/HSP70 family sugar kinase/biotin operon repressor
VTEPVRIVRVGNVMSATEERLDLPPAASLPGRGGGIPVAGSSGFPSGRALRPSTKVLPEHARGHNRSLVLQTLYGTGEQSRADVARATGLTRVTVSDLVAGLMAEGLIIEKGQREIGRPGKPATLIDIDRGRFQIIGLDLSAYESFRGAVLDIDGRVLSRAELPLEGSTGGDATARVTALVATLIDQATSPLLGIGVGSPGIVDLDGVVLSAPNLGWSGEPLQADLARRFELPVVVINDANAAVLAEHSFGSAESDMMLIKVGHGVGAGLLLGGTPLFGSRFAAGEIGHVVAGTDGGDECSCGKFGCLETWLATPRLDARLAAAPDEAARQDVLREAGERLGVVLAPIVGALNLAEIVLSGPIELLGGALAEATIETLRARTLPEFHGGLVLRMTTLSDDIVLRGSAVAVVSRQLGFS